MQSIIQSIHFDADSKLIQFIEKKLKSLEHLVVNSKTGTPQVNLRIEKNGSQVSEKVVELLINFSGTPLRIKSSGRRFEEAYLKAHSQLKRLIIKHKERLQAKH